MVFGKNNQFSLITRSEVILIRGFGQCALNRWSKPVYQKKTLKKYRNKIFINILPKTAVGLKTCLTGYRQKYMQLQHFLLKLTPLRALLITCIVYY